MQNFGDQMRWCKWRIPVLIRSHPSKQEKETAFFTPGPNSMKPQYFPRLENKMKCFALDQSLKAFRHV